MYHTLLSHGSHYPTHTIHPNSIPGYLGHVILFTDVIKMEGRAKSGVIGL